MSISLRKLLVGSLMAVFSFSPAFSALTFAPTMANAATLNTLVKGSGPTLYWYASNGKRLVFPNLRTFYSWYSVNDFSRVQVLGDTELYTLPLGGNVTYRPGARLVKITTDPRVYAVSRYGVLRWVSSESIARDLYGSNWAQWVDDIPDAFFTNYSIGSPIYTSSDYSVSNEFNSVVNPSDNMGAPQNNSNANNPNINVLSANVSLNANFTSFPTVSNDLMRISATVTNASIPTDNLLIHIYQEGVTAPEQTCWSVTNCVLVRSGTSQTTRTVRYYVDVLERGTNRFLTRAYTPTITLSGSTNGTTEVYGYLLTTVNRTTMSATDSLTLKADIDTSRSRLPANWKIEIVDPRTGAVLQTCQNTFICTAIVTPGSLVGVTNITFYAYLKDLAGNVIRNEWFPTVTITQAAMTAPVVTSPSANQVFTSYPRSITAQWQNTNSKQHRVQIDCNYCSVSTAWTGPSTFFNTNTYETAILIGGTTFPGDNQYRMRVRAIGTDGSEGPWSEFVYFTFQTNSVSVPSIPTFTAPTNNQQLTNFPRTLDITWTGSWVKRHVIELSCDICVSTINRYSNPTYLTTDQYEMNMLITVGGDNTYRMRIKAVNENGVESGWSDYTYFSFMTPATPANFTGTVTMTADNTLITPPAGNTALNMIATVTGSSVPIENLRIDLYADFNENYIQNTCLRSTTCAVSQDYRNVVVDAYFRYYAVVSDNSGRQLPRAYTPYIKILPQR